NNGGDGFIAARLLRGAGMCVSVGLLGTVAALKGDAAEAARRYGGRIDALDAVDLEAADLAIDALFGAGLARDLDGAARAAVERLNAWTHRTGRPIVAVDIPSGVDGTTGAVRGAAVEARVTITFFRRKPGHVLLPGRLHCGRVECADIGIADDVLSAIAPKTFINTPHLWRARFPVPSVEGHKYARGHAVVLSGNVWHTGAARLAARGALRVGAGLVTLLSPRHALRVNAAHLTAIMLAPCDGVGDLAEILADRRKNAALVGPGFGVGKATRAIVATLLARPAGDAVSRAIVLDADALTSFAGALDALAHLARQCGGPVVLTPHEGEFARLFSQIEVGSKLERARRAAALSGAIVLLKGPDTVVAHPDGRATIADDLPPWLATAGSGDVLAGIICGLLAQGMPPFEAAACAVFLHGEAGRRPGLISEDLPDALPSVLGQLLSQNNGGL
ncbi:MAG TPA: NAD(P)H-hydrate dehydratase, partial [Beijerinckiaceae bacterium]|nr:NAD(P)H-hydrate dehydratase [Beijerinckiaceae bacterium]